MRDSVNSSFPRLMLFVGCISSMTAMADHPAVNLDVGAAGPVSTIPARTLPKGMKTLSLSTQIVSNDELSDATLKTLASRHEHGHSTSSVTEYALSGAYGVTDNLTLGVRLPYIDRQNFRAGEHHHGGTGDQVVAGGDISGIGDLALFGQYRFFQSEGGRHAAAVLLGARAPTGTTDERSDQGELFEVDHQPGTGAWGGLFGLSWSSSFGRLGVDASVLYTLLTEGDRDTYSGDIINYNLSLAYRLLSGAESHEHAHESMQSGHHHHETGLLQSLDLVVELNGDWRDRVETAGEEEGNTGGNVIYFSPGLRANLAGGWSAYTSVGLPVITDLNGTQAEPDYRVIAGIGKTF